MLYCPDSSYYPTIPTILSPHRTVVGDLVDHTPTEERYEQAVYRIEAEAALESTKSILIIA